MNHIKQIASSQQAITRNLTDVIGKLNEKQNLENALKKNKLQFNLINQQQKERRDLEYMYSKEASYVLQDKLLRDKAIRELYKSQKIEMQRFIRERS